jgi:ABC-type uncharacterized transport system involved in gliding motility auxiliary subunit
VATAWKVLLLAGLALALAGVVSIVLTIVLNVLLRR